MRNAEPVIHTEEFNLASFPPSYPEIWLTHFRALGGECWNLPPITAGLCEESVGLLCSWGCAICWQNPSKAEQPHQLLGL